MTITTLTSRQFNQDAGGAKKAAERGPVIITDRGKPAHVLLGIQEYRRLIGRRRKIADLLAMPDVGDLELEIRQMREHARPAESGNTEYRERVCQQVEISVVAGALKKK